MHNVTKNTRENIMKGGNTPIKTRDKKSNLEDT